MIELNETTLDFSFPEVHPAASLSISFQRTLRIPDDGTDYPLPAGLGAFPVEHVDDHLRRVPSQWLKHGGVMLPMYQGEAMYIDFSSSFVEGHGVQYPFAVKIAAGKIDAVTGEGWSQELSTAKQNYIVVPDQPWLDGFCVKKGVIRQFVAMPLGEGYTAEEQITGKAEFGGLQISVHPMKRDVYEKYEAEERARKEALRREEERQERKDREQLRALLRESVLLRESLAAKYVELEQNQRNLLSVERKMEQLLAETSEDVIKLNRKRTELFAVGRSVSAAIACLLENLESNDGEMILLMCNLPEVGDDSKVMCCCSPGPDIHHSNSPNSCNQDILLLLETHSSNSVSLIYLS